LRLPPSLPLFPYTTLFRSVVDHGYDETLRRGDGEADVRARVEEDRLLAELRVHLAMAHERLRGDLRQDVGDGDANVRVALAKPRSEEHTSELQSRSDLVCR